MINRSFRKNLTYTGALGSIAAQFVLDGYSGFSGNLRSEHSKSDYRCAILQKLWF